MSILIGPEGSAVAQNIAYGAAAVAFALASAPQVVRGDDWPFIGTGPAADDPLHGAEQLTACALLGSFVREWPEAPLEALYRTASSGGVHSLPPDGFENAPIAGKVAYAVFRAALIKVDAFRKEMAARELARLAAQRTADPVLIRAEDTILEQHGGLLERHDDAPKMVTLGGGDAAEALAGTDATGLQPDDDAMAAEGPGQDGAPLDRAHQAESDERAGFAPEDAGAIEVASSAGAQDPAAVGGGPAVLDGAPAETQPAPTKRKKG